MNKTKSNRIIPQKNKEIKNQQSVAPKQYNSLFIGLGVLMIIFLGIKIYSNSFDCSFQFDDKHNIIDNDAIKSLSNIKEMWDINHSRFLAFYSFALNYYFDELNVEGYHKINLLIHLINSCLVFWMVRLLFATPGLKITAIANHSKAIALITAFLFVSHPLATGAVTYIVQRMASMVALFYFLSVALYMKGRILETKTKYWFFIGSIFSALMAIHTKENAYTLPFAIILIELFFINTKKISFNIKDYTAIFSTDKIELPTYRITQYAAVNKTKVLKTVSIDAILETIRNGNEYLPLIEKERKFGKGSKDYDYIKTNQ